MLAKAPRGRQEVPGPEDRRAADPRRAAGGVRPVRREAVQQGPRGVRRARARVHDRRGADRQGDPRVLLGRRRARARGLRHDRDLDGRDVLDAREPQVRHRRPGAARRRDEDRRRRRDPAQGREHLPRLLQERGRLVRRGRGRLAPHRRPRVDRRGRLPLDHRPQEGHHHHRGRQEPDAGELRERHQADALGQPVRHARRPPAVPRRADHARRGGDRPVGPAGGAARPTSRSSPSTRRCAS